MRINWAKIFFIIYLMMTIHCVVSLIKEFEMEQPRWLIVAIFGVVGLICLVRSLQLACETFKTALKEWGYGDDKE